MKRSYFWWGIPILLAVLFLVFSRPTAIAVEVMSVARGKVEKTVANTRAGTVKACQRSRLSLPIGGQIDQVLVTEGSRVTERQLLMVLWNKDRQAQLSQAKAMLNSTRLDRQGICANAELDAREANRLKGLAKRELVSEELFDRAIAKAEVSAFQCQAASSREQEAAAAVSLAQATLEQTYLYAPFAGMVAEVTGEVGEYSTPSPPGVATPPAIDLLTDDCHYIVAPIDEVDAADVRQGMPVRITLDAFKGRSFAGRVRLVAPYILDREKQARTVDVEVTFEPQSIAEQTLLAGYSADVEVILEAREDVIKIPTDVLIEENHVMVIDGEGILQLREVVVGISNWRDTEILSGLEVGDEIVSSLGLPGVEVGKPAQVDKL